MLEFGFHLYQRHRVALCLLDNAFARCWINKCKDPQAVKNHDKGVSGRKRQRGTRPRGGSLAQSGCPRMCYCNLAIKKCGRIDLGSSSAASQCKSAKRVASYSDWLEVPGTVVPSLKQGEDLKADFPIQLVKQTFSGCDKSHGEGSSRGKIYGVVCFRE